MNTKHTIILKESKAHVDYLISNNKYVEVINYSADLLFKNTQNHELFGYILNLLTTCLDIEQQHIKEDRYRSFVLNNIGILCYHNFKFEFAINYYFLAFVRLKPNKHFYYYHNLADSLSEMGDYEAALIYFDKAIQLLAEYKADGVIEVDSDELYHLYILDKVQCLFNYGKIDKAIALFKTINTALLPKPFSANYYLVDLYLAWHNLSYTDFLNKFHETKQHYKQNNSNKYVLDLNNYLLNNSAELTNNEIEKLLIENVELALKASHKETEKKTLTAIIKFYKSLGNTKKVNEYLELFFVKIQLEKRNYDTQLMNLYLTEISALFDDLKEINLEVTAKKEDLQNITHILSHDLKTPLRTIRSFAGLLKKDIEKKDYSRLDSHLSYIRNSSENLYKLIEDVNLMNKLERNINEHETIDLNKVVNAVSVSLDYMVYKKNAIISASQKAPKIKANYSAISILFQNIIQNGLKYNKSEKPTVKISYTINKQELIVTFTDNGIGISEEYFEQVFVFFKRLHTDDEYDGTGFGLGICKKIINSYGGNITVESEKGKGSEFIVSLPIKMVL